MTDFLERLEADLYEAAQRRGQERRQPPRGALKAVALIAALALLALAATRLAGSEAERVASERTPIATPIATPTPTPGHPPREHEIAAVTAGDPAFLDLLAGPLGSQWGPPIPTGDRPGTAPSSFGSMVLYRAGAREAAQAVGFSEEIDRIEPLTPERERLIDADLRAADVVVVYGLEDQQRMLEDPDICRPAGSVADGPLTLCIRRSDEARSTRFVVDGRALPVGPISEHGWWSWAAAAPGGEMILAEWTTYTSNLSATKHCIVPQAALIAADSGRAQPASVEAAVALGWTTDGRAIVFRPATSGCGSEDAPGLYLVATDGRGTLLEPTDREAPPPGLEPSIEPRSAEDVQRAAAP